MVTMERSIMDHIVGSPDVRETWGLEAAIRSMIFDLLALDYHGWQAKLAADGFTEDQIEKLNGFVDRWVSEFDTAGLSRQLQDLRDIGNGSAMERILSEWIRGISSAELHRLIAREQFPNPLDVLCYAMAQVKQALSGIVAFELMRREIELDPTVDWSLEENQIEYGTELAEIGLAEDAKTWPQY